MRTELLSRPVFYGIVLVNGWFLLIMSKTPGEMDDHEILDGTYAATVATCKADLVTFIAPLCEPTVLIAPEKILPQKELSPGDSVKITIAGDTITNLEDGAK